MLNSEKLSAAVSNTPNWLRLVIFLSLVAARSLSFLRRRWSAASISLHLLIGIVLTGRVHWRRQLLQRLKVGKRIVVLEDGKVLHHFRIGLFRRNQGRIRPYAAISNEDRRQ